MSVLASLHSVDETDVAAASCIVVRALAGVEPTSALILMMAAVAIIEAAREQAGMGEAESDQVVHALVGRVRSAVSEAKGRN